MKRLGRCLPKVVQIQSGNCPQQNYLNDHGKRKSIVSKGICVKMMRWGHACLTFFDRNRDGDFVYQYLQISLLWTFDW